MQAIGNQKIQREEPSSKLVLALAGALLGLLCLLVVVAAALNQSTQPVSHLANTVAAQPASDGGSQDGQPTFGAIP